MTTSKGTYPWSFVTQYIPSFGQVMMGTVKLDDFNLPIRNPCSVASLLASIKEIIRNHKLWNIGSTEIYVLHMQVLLECCYI